MLSIIALDLEYIDYSLFICGIIRETRIGVLTKGDNFMARGFDFDKTLGVCWSIEENDWKIYYPKKASGWYVYGLLTSDSFKALIQELRKAGYDEKSFRASIKLKNEEGKYSSNKVDKETALGVYWSKRKKEWIYTAPKGDVDGLEILEKYITPKVLSEIMKEMMERKYVPETFCLSIRKK